MRILYIHQHFGTPAGASGTRSYEFAKALIAAGHEVTMICGASGRSETGLTGPYRRGRRDGAVEGIRVVEYRIGYETGNSIATRIAKFLRFGAASARHALREPYDLVFCTSTPLTAAVPGILARWLRAKPFVFEVRDLWPELPRAMGVTNPVLLGGMSALEWAGYQSARTVIGLAPGIVDGVVRRGIRPERTRLIPNGCDLDLFAAAPPIHASALFPDRIAPGDFVAIYAGAHGIANHLEALLPVAAELGRMGRADIKLLLVGSGATKAALVAEAARLNLHNLVFADNVPKTELIPLMKGADVGLQLLKNVPAFYDGTSPNKFFDYLAAGIPVLTNYPGWIARLIETNGCGAVVPPEDPSSFARALATAADGRDAWRARGRASTDLARASFDRAKLAIDFVEVLEGAVPAK